MKLIVDKQSDHASPVAKDEIREYLKRLREEYVKNKRLIERCECDGQVCDIQMIISGEKEMDAVQEVNITTKSVEDTVRDALREVYSCLPKLREYLEAVCVCVRTDKIVEGVQAYAHLLPFLNRLALGLISIKKHGGADMSFDIDRFMEILKVQNDALAGKDYVRFSDSIEYTLIPQLDALLDKQG
jgi:hypothetical protein